MSLGYLFLFIIMVVPSLIAVAIAPRSFVAVIWNYTWFLILAKVGLLAFDSTWGAVPALFFTLQYAIRMSRPRPAHIPNINFRAWMKASANRHEQSAPQAPTNPKSAQGPQVIEAEFRRES